MSRRPAEGITHVDRSVSMEVEQPNADDGLKHNHQPTVTSWEFPLHTEVHCDEFWQDVLSSGNLDMPLPRDEQQILSIWDASSQHAISQMVDQNGGHLEFNMDVNPPGPTSPSNASTPTQRSRQNLSEPNLMRRRSQNRVAQRAYRARQLTRLQSLEDQLSVLSNRHSKLERDYLQLAARYQGLLEKLEAPGDGTDNKMVIRQDTCADDFESLFLSVISS